MEDVKIHHGDTETRSLRGVKNKKYSVLPLCLCVSVFILFLTGCGAPTVEELMHAWVGANSPGAAVLVISDGKVLYENGFGLANLETREPVTTDTLFDLASVSKQFTAMGILILADQGKLSVDDPITKYLPVFAGHGDNIKIRNLLNHTSGLPEYDALFSRLRNVHDTPRSAKTPPDAYEPTTLEAVDLVASQTDPAVLPGSRFEYSNSGYVLLARIIEVVSGQPFAQFMKQRVFEPLGMSHTLIYDETRPQIPGRAVSYQQARGGFQDIDYDPLNLIYGDGNVNTSVADMAQWVRGLDQSKLVKPSTLQQIFTPGKASDGSDLEYGFGWFTGTCIGQPCVLHSGSWLGFQSVIEYIPTRRFAVVILANSTLLEGDRREQLAERVGALYLNQK